VRVREPIVPGHEAAGHVAALGANVSGLALGDLVAVNPSQPCGHCRFCREGLHIHCLNMQFMGSAMRLPHTQGMFSDWLVVPAMQCLPAGSLVSAGEAACAEPLDAALDRAMGCGATKAINVRRNPEELAAYETDKGQFDVVFECSAAEQALRSAIAAVRPRGLIVQVGVTGDMTFPLNALVGKELRLVGSQRFDSEFALAVRLIGERRIDVRPIISHTFPVEQAVEAFEQAGDRSAACKVQLSFLP
jgi:L-idonate 5-dehydrogenase